MKKKCIIFFIFMSICFVGCNNTTANKNLLFNDVGSGELTEIYKLKDGSTVYSEFVNIQYKDSKTGIIELSQALKTKKITIDEILNKSNKIDHANDGGSILYTFIGNENDLSDMDFYVIQCKENNQGIKDIIFGTHNIVVNGCNIVR